MIARLIYLGALAVAACFCLLLLLTPNPAHATCGGKPCASPATSLQSDSAAQARAHASAYGGAGGSAHALGGSVNSETGNFYVLPTVVPVGGASLPAGICQTSNYDHSSWAFLGIGQSSAKGGSHTDMDCLNAILTVQKMRTEWKPEPRLPEVPRECIHPAPKKAPVAVVKKRARICT